MRRPTILACFACLCAASAVCSPAMGAGRDTTAIVKELTGKHGEGQRARIERGVAQVAALWTDADGDLAAFAREHFIADPKLLDATLRRFEETFESVDGYMYEIVRAVRMPLDVDVGPILAVDPLLGGWDPAAHLTDDLFATKVGFVVLLNFPLTPLERRLSEGKSWSRRQWVECRLSDRFSRRVPAEVAQQMSAAASDGELYISGYNVWMHHIVDARGERRWPKGVRLISHWNLRDELKAAYADPRGGIDKQRAIVKVMERIVTQTIPAAVIDNPRVDWDPSSNAVTPAPAAEIESDAPPARTGAAGAAPEPSTRYRKLLAIYQAFKLADRFAPNAPTVLARAFEQSEIPEERVVALLTEVLESPLVPRVAALIERRLGRKLEPQDLWYGGFQARSGTAEADLDALTRKRYPTAAAFAKDIPRILGRLGFPKKEIDLVAAHVIVDPSRGAGHAMEAMRRGEAAHLRTRVEKDGMTYKGYNIAVHELGHNVEQVISLYEVDSTLLQGVPITAITEALAFVFQNRDLELLGKARPSAAGQRQAALDSFWGAWEIAGVGLLEIRVWHWMYQHPDASPEQLRDAVMGIARELWNRYYAPVLGEKDSVLLGIYSHMLSTPVYLYNYPIGHLVAAQLEEHFAAAGAGKLGTEFARAARLGRVTPDLWMENATGAPLGTAALFRAAEAALAAER